MSKKATYFCAYENSASKIVTQNEPAVYSFNINNSPKQLNSTDLRKTNGNSSNKSFQKRSSKEKFDQLPPPPYNRIDPNYYHKNINDLKTLENIVFKHDFCNSEIFWKLVCILKGLSTYMAQASYRIIYQWHSIKVITFKQLLNELLQKLNNVENKIINFMVILNHLFHRLVETAELSEIDVYYNFIRFSDFIKKCILLSNDKTMRIEWLPNVWNNCFYYSCFIVENIIFNENKFNTIHTLIKWSKVPSIQNLIKILSYHESYDNQKHSVNINEIHKIKNSVEQYILNIIEPKSHTKSKEPVKKIKLTASDQVIKKRAPQSTHVQNPMVEIVKTNKDTNIQSNSSITQKNTSATENKRIPQEPQSIFYARAEHEYNQPRNIPNISTKIIQVKLFYFVLKYLLVNNF